MFLLNLERRGFLLASVDIQYFLWYFKVVNIQEAKRLKMGIPVGYRELKKGEEIVLGNSDYWFFLEEKKVLCLIESDRELEEGRKYKTPEYFAGHINNKHYAVIRKIK